MIGWVNKINENQLKKCPERLFFFLVSGQANIFLFPYLLSCTCSIQMERQTEANSLYFHFANYACKQQLLLLIIIYLYITIRNVAEYNLESTLHLSPYLPFLLCFFPLSWAPVSFIENAWWHIYLQLSQCNLNLDGWEAQRARLHLLLVN